jgi:hypothetical protein
MTAAGILAIDFRPYIEEGGWAVFPILVLIYVVLRQLLNRI